MDLLVAHDIAFWSHLKQDLTPLLLWWLLWLLLLLLMLLRCCSRCC